jgi:hypothetical protein
MADINNGFQPGEKEHKRDIISLSDKEFRRNDRYYKRVLTLRRKVKFSVLFAEFRLIIN